jgi:PAS domain S-box-containing protein
MWLYLLGAVTFLIIKLRRVLRRVKPLSDEVYSSRIVVDNVQSGVAWVLADGNVGSVNHSLAESLGRPPKNLAGLPWRELFAPDEDARLQEAYGRMLLSGKAWLDAHARRSDGAVAWFQVLLIAVHDHKTRFVGHHCLVKDCTRERELEAELRVTRGSVVTAG